MSQHPSLQPHVCCIGNPVAGNPTQFVMSRASKECGLDWRFFTSQVEDEAFEIAVRGVQALGLQGMVLLEPFQNRVIPLLDTVTESALRLNRVSIARSDGNSWLGDNLLPTALWQTFEARLSASTATRGTATNVLAAPASTDATGASNGSEVFDGSNLIYFGSESLYLALESTRPTKSRGLDSSTGESGQWNLIDGKQYLASLANSQETHESEAGASTSASVESEAGKAESSVQDASQSADRVQPIFRALLIEDDIDNASLKGLLQVDWDSKPMVIWLAAGGRSDKRKLRETFQSRGFAWIEQVEWMSLEASANFAFWTGANPPIDLIRESLEEYLQW